MASNLVFALNSTMPLFILMALGYFLRRIKILDEGFLKTANKFNFYVTLSALLFTDMANTDFKEIFDWKLLVFCAGATTVMFWGIWGACRLFMKDKESVGEFVQASYRSSVAVMGIALIQNIYGSAGAGGVMLLGCVPLFNIYAVTVLLAGSKDAAATASGGARLKKTLLGIVKNPIVISLLLGFISSIIGIDYPKIVDSSLSMVARLASPLALICIGGEFDFGKAFAKLGKSIAAAICKLVILPVIFIPIAIACGFTGDKLVAIFVMLSIPTTPSAFIMAKQYGYDGVITSSTVVLTTLLSSVTLTAFLFILRSLGYI